MSMSIVRKLIIFIWMVHVPVFVVIAIDRKDLVLLSFGLLDLLFSNALLQEIEQESKNRQF